MWRFAAPRRQGMPAPGDATSPGVSQHRPCTRAVPWSHHEQAHWYQTGRAMRREASVCDLDTGDRVAPAASAIGRGGAGRRDGATLRLRVRGLPCAAARADPERDARHRRRLLVHDRCPVRARSHHAAPGGRPRARDHGHPSDPAGPRQVLRRLREAGIPMRRKVSSGIVHWKMMLFAGQRVVQFSGAATSHLPPATCHQPPATSQPAPSDLSHSAGISFATVGTQFRCSAAPPG
jgi:hypothetical protein